MKNKEFDGLAEKKSVQGLVDKVKVAQSSVRLFGQGLTPNFIGLDKRSAIRLATKLGLKLKSIGIGVVKKQFPLAGVKGIKNTKHATKKKILPNIAQKFPILETIKPIAEITKSNQPIKLIVLFFIDFFNAFFHL